MANLRTQKKATYSKRRNDLAMLFLAVFASGIAIFRPDASWAGEVIIAALGFIATILGIHRYAMLKDFQTIRSTPDVADDPDAS